MFWKVRLFCCSSTAIFMAANYVVWWSERGGIGVGGLCPPCLEVRFVVLQV